MSAPRGLTTYNALRLRMMSKRRGDRQQEIEKQARLVAWLKDRTAEEALRLLQMKGRLAA